MSRHQFYVATSFLPTVDFPGRDTKIQVATSLCSPHKTPLSRPKTLVATSNHHKAARTMSRHQFDVATPRPVSPPATPKQVVHTTRSRLPSLVATSRPAKPGRDLITMSQPQEVLTHNKLFFFFFKILQ